MRIWVTISLMAALLAGMTSSPASFSHPRVLSPHSVVSEIVSLEEARELEPVTLYSWFPLLLAISDINKLFLIVAFFVGLAALAVFCAYKNWDYLRKEARDLSDSLKTTKSGFSNRFRETTRLLRRKLSKQRSSGRLKPITPDRPISERTTMHITRPPIVELSL